MVLEMQGFEYTMRPELPEPSSGEEAPIPAEKKEVCGLKATVTKVPAQESENTPDSVHSSPTRRDGSLQRSANSSPVNLETSKAIEFSDSNGSYLVLEQRLNDQAYPNQNNNNPTEEVALESSGSSDRSENSPLLTSPDERQGFLTRNKSLPTKLTAGINDNKPRYHSNHSSPVKRSGSSASQWSSKSSTNSAPVIGDYVRDLADETLLQDNYNYSYTDAESIPISYKARNGTLYLPLDHMAKKGDRGSVRKSGKKKRRSGSWINILSPNYKQKNDDFHKFFKELPDSERLLVDYACALVKDILVQGRLYVSQNYVCFRSNILKWQTMVTFPLKDIACVTKEKTVKVIPNAIQFQVKTRGKFTFTSFTARDRVFQQINKLLENALQDKPMTPQELWSSVHDQYGSDLGCSSDDDYVKPIDSAFNYNDLDSPMQNGEPIQFGKKKRSKKQSKKMNGRVQAIENSTENEKNLSPDQPIEPKSSSRESDSEYEDLLEEENEEQEEGNMEVDTISKLPQTNGVESDEEYSADLAFEDLKRTYLVREYDIPASEMFTTIFGETCSFWADYLDCRGGSDVNITGWGESEQNQANKIRNLDYNLDLNNPLGPKSAPVEETQVWYNHVDSGTGKYYAVDCIAKTLGIPYSDYFSTVMRYSIRKLRSKSCELKISAEIKFRKTPWGLVKNFIEKNAYSGIEENFIKLEKELDLYLDQLKEDTLQPKSLRQRRSVSSLCDRRSKSLSSALEVPGTNLTVGGDCFESEINNFSSGDVTRMRKREVIAAPTTVQPIVHKRDVNNNNKNLRVSRNSINVESNSRRYFYGAAIFIIALLLLSNYSLYQRLNVLEQFHISKNYPSNNIEVMENLVNDGERNPFDSDNLKISGQLSNLERRLAQLENVVQGHVTTSQNRWQALTSEWKELQQTISHILKRIEAKWKT